MGLQDLELKVENAIQKREIELRELYLDYLSSIEFRHKIDQNSEIFHKVLIQCRDLGWIHYTRLAAAMDLEDASTASRWFKPANVAKTPDKFRRRAAIDALRRIIRHDIERIAAGDKPIGGRSMKEHPDLGIVKIGYDDPVVA